MNWKKKEEKALQEAERKVLQKYGLTEGRTSVLEEQKELYEKQSQHKGISRLEEMASKMGKITNTQIKSGKLVPMYDEQTHEIIKFSQE